MPPAQRSPHQSPTRQVRLFATCAPGLGPLLCQELTHHGVAGFGRHGHDGRSDLVSFTVAEPVVPALAAAMRLADDVLVQVGHTRLMPADRPGWVADRLLHHAPLQDALHLARRLHGSGPNPGTVRAVVRVLSEKLFTRTALRASVQKAILRLRPGCKIADPADFEVWVCQYGKDAFIAGLRLTNAVFRQHHGRVAQRPGALRPPVAAAMVLLAGPPTGMLVDPCCGSGTIVGEAIAAGWNAIGCDLDPRAVAAARANLPGAQVSAGDCRNLNLAADTVGAWVSNVPFGRQYTMAQTAPVWLRETLAEAARVVRPGGRIVLLSPHLPRSAVPADTHLLASHRIRLLGVPATIWVLQPER